jgi:hypothetical protein
MIHLSLSAKGNDESPITWTTAKTLCHTGGGMGIQQRQKILAISSCNWI